MVPTDWNAGVVLSLHHLRTSLNESGSAYLDVPRPYLRGDLLPPTYWPGNDVAILRGLGETRAQDIPGRGEIAVCRELGTRFMILDRPAGTSDAYMIEFALRNVEGARDWEPHVYASGAYLPIARVGETDRYIGVASIHCGWGGVDLYIHNPGYQRIAFYYLKIQRVSG